MDTEKIKTRETVKDIKFLDKSKVLKDKIKDVSIHTKDDLTSVSRSGREETSPGRFAEDKIADKSGKALDGVVGKGKKGTKLLVRTIKDRFRKTKRNQKNENTDVNNKANPLQIKRKLDRDKSKASFAGANSNVTAKHQHVASKKFVTDKHKKMFQKKQLTASAVGKKAKSGTSKLKSVKKGISKSLRAAIAATRSLVTAISAGGLIAVVIVIIICFIGFLAASPMGVFFSNDSKETNMSDVVSELNIEFFEKIEKIKKKKKHDDYVLASTDGNNSINWNEVLAVYAVKTAIDPDNATEVVSMDDIKKGLLRSVLYDMNKIKSKVTTVKEKEKGKVYDVKVLTVTIHKKTPAQMAKKYKFTKEQQDMLTEILKPTYDELWASLLYGSGGNGEIIGGLGNGQLAWPVPGYSANTSSYGMRKHPVTGKYKMHNGTDLAAPTGTKIVAAEKGKVISAGWNSGGYGNFTIIDHGKGLVTRYAHQSKIIVKAGSTVKRGQVIGLVGSTGLSTGPHLHFEVLINGQFDNPMMYIKK